MRKKLSEHFALSEFIAESERELFKSHNLYPLWEARLRVLAHELEVIRTHIGGPIIVTSGWRSPVRNKAVGGSRTSGHMTGWAADFQRPGWDARRLFDLVKSLGKRGLVTYDQLIGYPAHVHLSVDARSRMEAWTV
ncbi:D-Ala-D-Ala carboxypeptidase family metallohydrolase [Sphingosinicella rhizophila]|uniref:D-Ala-D-Ala carboxypeptidase family metallohydrolase n=1 Tax=Sphingosinicella rhizophila TaxID=3050082 RepID=A0ABU3Q2W8_9SPHN|nr:D-Ala-D-Ala carboxypeptidase family metallohydrolase [Sphingosinicella sp. GR2756]MDT9597657.1 D-Ala-D-Ala carboxypeptidase family metallohydrolase [Sphingosinicella sp. GR2756]